MPLKKCKIHQFLKVLKLPLFELVFRGEDPSTTPKGDYLIYQKVSKKLDIAIVTSDDNRWWQITTNDNKWQQMTRDDIIWHQMSSEILRYLNIEILKYWDFGILRYWNIEILLLDRYW